MVKAKGGVAAANAGAARVLAVAKVAVAARAEAAAEAATVAGAAGADEVRAAGGAKPLAAAKVRAEARGPALTTSRCSGSISTRTTRARPSSFSSRHVVASFHASLVPRLDRAARHCVERAGSNDPTGTAVESVSASAPVTAPLACRM